MFKIIRKKELPGDCCQMDIAAPRIAASALPGQFIIIKMEKTSERIPLTISDHDANEGYIRIVFMFQGNRQFTSHCCISDHQSNKHGISIKI